MINRKLKCFLILLAALLIAGCIKQCPYKYPPVTNGWRSSSSVKFYRVQSKDTLYSIAWGFGMDFRDLAQINNLQSPYHIKAGQKLHFSRAAISKRSVAYKTKITKKRVAAKPLKSWRWPANGKIIAKFNAKTVDNNGLDIAAKIGQPVFASNGGEVVYSGTGLRSYGKLIIIKHNDDYLSAYAYNQKMLVKEGQSVKQGQKIGTIGYNNERKPCLHFEIRRFGKPVDPLLYLKKGRSPP